jgi:hypothetical protein
MPVPSPFRIRAAPSRRRAYLGFLAAFYAALLGGACHGAALAQVVLGLPDDALADTSTAARQPASAEVKAGMAAIRRLVLDTHTLITHRRLSPEAARRFAADLRRHTASLRTDPAAASLAVILTPLEEGAVAVAGPTSGSSQLDGLDKIETALDRYPQLFDDPDWKPLR